VELGFGNVGFGLDEVKEHLVDTGCFSKNPADVTFFISATFLPKI
jgi:hypothetical protein